ncbi:MAG: hypothetical protein NTX82_03435 [Candidatus Parcubacteria bacterium]|nr:hypothetical protein [Candidatus Parcubacteria bacterium]
MNKPLREQILKMVARDQRMRFSGIWDFKIDRENTKALKIIIKKYGWPDIPLIGKKASLGAFLLAQHADRDLKFQKLCLKLLTEKFRKHNVEPQSFAYLTDRVLVNSGGEQIYGTQFYTDKKTGEFGPRPIKDKKNLFKRRRQMKLGSFWADYKLLLKRHRKMQIKK